MRDHSLPGSSCWALALHSPLPHLASPSLSVLACMPCSFPSYVRTLGSTPRKPHLPHLTLGSQLRRTLSWQRSQGQSRCKDARIGCPSSHCRSGSLCTFSRLHASCWYCLCRPARGVVDAADRHGLSSSLLQACDGRTISLTKSQVVASRQY